MCPKTALCFRTRSLKQVPGPWGSTPQNAGALSPPVLGVCRAPAGHGPLRLRNLGARRGERVGPLSGWVRSAQPARGYHLWTSTWSRRLRAAGRQGVSCRAGPCSRSHVPRSSPRDLEMCRAISCAPSHTQSKNAHSFWL